MKQFKFLSSAIIAMLLLFSCNSNSSGSGSVSSTDSTTKDSTSVTTQPAIPPAPAMTLLIKQKVADFNRWFPAYESHDSVRIAGGLHNYVVGRGIKDSNMVLVALKMDDTAKAKQFAMSPDLMNAMKKAGVMGKPTFAFNISKFHDSSTEASTQRAIFTFKVKDYDTWKKVFDGDKQDRINAGITDRGINQSISDPGMITLVLAIADMKKAQDFLSTKELKQRMDSAGVVGAPDVYFYHVVKQY